LNNKIDLKAAFGMKPEAAANYFRSKGYRFSWHWYDTWQDAHAAAFTVAKAMKIDLLNDIRGAVDDAINDGTALSKFKKDLEPKLRARGWWGKKIDKNGKQYWAGTPARLKLIYEQNLHTAYAAGRYKSLAATVTQRPYWQYIAVLDGRTRPAHLELAGRIARADDPFWQYYYPPNGWNCRCSVRSLAGGDIGNAGFDVHQAADGQITAQPVKGKISEPEILWEQKSLRRRTISVPHGIDPGWAYNPGKAAWQPDLDKYPRFLAKQYLTGAVTGPDFKRFFEGKIGGNFPVAVLSENMQQAIGSRNQTIYLSGESLSKNRDHHPELKLDEYQKLPNIISDNADVIIKDGEQSVIFIALEGRYYQAVVKSTKTGENVFMTSLRRVSNLKGEIGRLRRKAGVKVIKDTVSGEAPR